MEQVNNEVPEDIADTRREKGTVAYTQLQLQALLAVLELGCQRMQLQLASGQLSMPAREMSELCAAVQALKKANVAPKESRSKKKLEVAAPPQRLGSFIKRHLVQQ